MSDLRDFIYLDAVRLRSFISQVQGGLVSEMSEKIRELGALSAGVDAGLPTIVGGKVNASKEKESERQQLVQITDPAYFDALYRHLRQTGLVDITNSSISTREELRVGQFIEMQGVAEPPAIETWVEQAQGLFEFFNRNARAMSSLQGKKKQSQKALISTHQLHQYRAVMDFFRD